MYAIEKFIRDNNPEWNVVRISTVDSVNDVIDVIRTGNNGKMKELRNIYQKADVLLVDSRITTGRKKVVVIGEKRASEKLRKSCNRFIEV